MAKRNDIEEYIGLSRRISLYLEQGILEKKLPALLEDGCIYKVPVYNIYLMINSARRAQLQKDIVLSEEGWFREMPHLPEPEIIYFSPSVKTIVKGQKVLLTWSVQNAEKVEISGRGLYLPVASEGQVYVLLYETTNLTIKAVNGDGIAVEQMVEICLGKASVAGNRDKTPAGTAEARWMKVLLGIAIPLIILGMIFFAIWVLFGWYIPKTSSGELLSPDSTGNVYWLPQMVTVSAGTFVVGLNGKPEKYPSKTVETKEYQIGMYEVTIKQYLEFAEAVGDHYPVWMRADSDFNIEKGKKKAYKNILADAGQYTPVTGISWSDAVAYCRWLSMKTDNHYTLPTEKQWEYAARGGKHSGLFVFSGGNKAGEAGWYSANSGNVLHHTGWKMPNELGIYDMSGNAKEWCMDCYESGKKLKPDKDGHLHCKNRVVRGGSVKEGFSAMKPVNRYACDPEKEYPDVGFRVVKIL